MSSNYPPGVTGNEYEIAGPDYEQESNEVCPECQGRMMERGYHGEKWLSCCECSYQVDLPSIRELREDYLLSQAEKG